MPYRGRAAAVPPGHRMQGSTIVVGLLTLGITIASALLALYVVVLIARNRTVDNPAVWASIVIEVASLVLLVRGLIGVFSGAVDEPITLALYLLLVPCVLPGALLWSAGEKSRSATAVVLAALAVLMVLMLRVDALWVSL
jgi:hypothetical protein